MEPLQTLTLFGVFLSSLLGSLHCVGMCGGFVALASNPVRPLLPALTAYHLARLLAYAALGALAGAIGGSLMTTASLLGVRQIASLVFGILLIIAGVLVLFPIRRSALQLPLVGSVRRELVHIGKESPSVRGPLVLGLLSALLPCGWLYMFVFAAAATGGALSGTALMLAFWAGTVPALIALACGIRFMARPIITSAPKVVAVFFILAGCVSLYMHNSGLHDHSHAFHQHDAEANH